MAAKLNKQTSKGVAFEIKVDEKNVATGSKKPKHLMKRMGNVENRPNTPDALVSKQQEAERRRQTKENERIKKLQAHVNHVEKVSADTKKKKEKEKPKESEINKEQNHKSSQQSKPMPKSEAKKPLKPVEKNVEKSDDKKAVQTSQTKAAKPIKKTGK